MKRDDGGSAFPRLSKLQGTHVDVPTYYAESVGGMSLRDWFAGQALQGIVQDCMFERVIPDGRGRTETDLAAERAYAVADAMLAARERAPEAKP